MPGISCSFCVKLVGARLVNIYHKRNNGILSVILLPYCREGWDGNGIAEFVGFRIFNPAQLFKYLRGPVVFSQYNIYRF
ncbi:hypothetical protein D3C86_1844730 [compost metagenome]